MPQFQHDAIQMLCSALLPDLESVGFVRDERDPLTLTFRRAVAQDGFDVIQIIHVQLGEEGSLFGHFTIDLGVFSSRFCQAYGADVIDRPETWDCLHDLTKRLGFLFEPPKSLLSRLFGADRKMPHDYWWKLSGLTRAVSRNIGLAKECLIQRGIPWLDEMSTEAKFQWAIEELQSRKELIARRGPPRVIGPLFQPGEEMTRKSLRRKLDQVLEDLNRPTDDGSTDDHSAG